MAKLNELDALIRDLNDRNINDKVNREALQTTHVGLLERIFQEGRDAHGNKLGTYTEPYLKRRKKEQRRTNRRINLQFTGQMKNDFKLKVLGNDRFGSGFDNSANADKSGWVEDTYDTEIFKLSSDELKKLKENFEFVARKRLSR